MQHYLEVRPLPEAAFVQPHWRATGPLPWLSAVAVAFALMQLALVVPGSGLSWDETVYVSQLGGSAPPAFFSAPRARGISYLIAPVTAFTTSTTALRIYLALLSALLLFLALWVWRKVLSTPVVACAGALFAGLWPTLFYGPAAMPNLWCALGALAAVGCLLRAVRDPDDRAARVGSGLAVALVALMRPADGISLTLPLALAAVLLPGRRRPAVLAVLVGGLLVGCAPWAVEALTHYGGLVPRLRRASDIQGGLGWHPAVADQAGALAGQTLCRPCGGAWHYPVTAAWWAAVPVLAIGGIVVARRTPRALAGLLATVTALCMAVPYLFLIDYAAPRFLLPVYALLAVPVAECLIHLFTGLRSTLRPFVAGALIVALGAHLVVQLRILDSVTSNSRATTARYTAMAGALQRLGVHAPCVVSGADAVPVAYYAGCASRQTGGHDASTTPQRLTAAAHRLPMAVIVAGRHRPPGYARGWRSALLPQAPETAGTGPYRVYLAPSAKSPDPEPLTTVKEDPPGSAPEVRPG